MKIKYYIVLSLFVMMFSCDSILNYSTSGAKDVFKIHRGVNTSHWLSQTEIRGEERELYMQERDFKKIAELGFDHVRIPIDEEQMWDSLGNKNKEAFKLLHKGIKWAIEHNLSVIVDLHILRSHHFNTDNKRLWTDPKAQQQFWDFWKQLSRELKRYPTNKLAYELLNEAVAENPEDWNNLIANGIKTIRKNEPNRKIIVGSNNWQTVYTFPDLKIPENDTNIILSFHFYEPFIITHYQAPWNPLYLYDGNLNYPGYTIDTAEYENWEGETLEVLKAHNGEYSREIIDQKISVAVDVAKKYKLQLYCGEFGCFPSTPLLLRQLVYRDLIAVFDKYDIAWTHWNYKNDFPLVRPETLDPINEINNILLDK